ncbi:cysteine--tRNA ligase [Thioclava sp. F1Mire-8]|uniref:cysteine--tRNA ligase n=1 Tax=Thioclava sp. F1Mire-8 TaxID=1973006 RepID=UPI000B5465B0|nr:cysteine--tRNA ligase [Thioclava sp. F1Mire-8]OWY05090.1 cysteine--tRNA ligase [Thioclava sp. F1Mire-8]
MTQIRLRNSLTRKVEDFHPIDAKIVRMYLCGPTVYDRAHLGNARPVVVFDVLYRLLRHVYGPEHVTYVRNFTDVDDKINATALARKEAGADGSLEELIRARTEETIGWYHADMDALGALRPDREPRATDYIGAMIAMIETLIEDGHAYAAEGHVLFRVRSYKDYGALSGRTVDDMMAGARVEVAPFKEDPMDFVLWKPSDEGLPGWESPWGRGRPGWHIECSAMSYELLGASFDIHGGGIDLQFPHHENEIAQSCCAHPEGSFANYWLHNEMLQVEGKKMSKSLGNFFTVRDLLDGHDGEKGIPGEVIRFVFLQTHYTKPMDWTAEKARAAFTQVDFWANEISPAHWIIEEFQADPIRFTKVYAPEAIVEALANDLNTSLALTELQSITKSLHGMKRAALTNDELDSILRQLLAGGYLLGIDLIGFDLRQAPKVDLSGLADKLAALRTNAMETKDFAPVDAMKQALVAAGVEVRMSKAGVELLPGPDFDPAKLEGL